MANKVNETRKRAVEALCNYHRYREAGLSERQIADLFGIRSIVTLRLFKSLLRYYVVHEHEEANPTIGGDKNVNDLSSD